MVLIISDAECIKRCANREIDALGILVHRYEQALRAVLVARRVQPSLIDDAIQDAFVRAYSAAERKSCDQPFFPWLVGIAMRVAQELNRSQRTPAPGANGKDYVKSYIAAESRDESDEALLRAVEGLPEPFRTTLMLRYFGSYSCAEIADYMAAPLGTITKRLSRAHALLRESLNPSARKDEAYP